ncbi:MAG: cytochrome P450 [Caldilineaceae bacterium]|nr:cytochrome P450 [Caldilineaceae bacterium]
MSISTLPAAKIADDPACVKQVKPWWFLFRVNQDPLAVLEQLALEHGDIAQVKIGPRHLVLLSHPDFVHDLLVTNGRDFVKGPALQRARRLLGNGLLTSEGETHLRDRRMVQPAFHRERVAVYAETMVTEAERMASQWTDGATLDMAKEMMRLTLVVAGKTLFDASVEDDAQAVGEAMDELMHLFNVINNPLSEWLLRLPLSPANRLRAADSRLRTIVQRMIAERRAGVPGDDLLSMLLMARDVEGDGRALSDAQILDEVLTLFLAGHETTANALTWSWYLLSQNPAAAARLHQEVDEVLKGRLPTVEDVPALSFTRAVFNEALRLYPPAWVIGREAVSEVKIGGVTIPAGASVLASPWIIHRDPRFYRQPEQFNPERWQPELAADRHKLAFFPFGSGSRKCIGESFAWMEGVLVLATLAQRWRLRLDPNQRIALQPSVTLRPRYGMQMTVASRSM